VLAGLVGRTEDWLSRVENNKIELDRLSVIRRLADAPDVSIGDLVAEPTLLDWTSDSGTRTVPALRSALMDYRQVSALLAGAGNGDGEPPSLDALHPRHRRGVRRLPCLPLRLRHRSGAPRTLRRRARRQHQRHR